MVDVLTMTQLEKNELFVSVSGSPVIQVWWKYISFTLSLSPLKWTPNQPKNVIRFERDKAIITLIALVTLWPVFTIMICSIDTHTLLSIFT